MLQAGGAISLLDSYNQRAKGGTVNGDPYSRMGYIMGILRLYT